MDGGGVALGAPGGRGFAIVHMASLGGICIFPICTQWAEASGPHGPQATQAGNGVAGRGDLPLNSPSPGICPKLHCVPIIYLMLMAACLRGVSLCIYNHLVLKLGDCCMKCSLFSFQSLHCFQGLGILRTVRQGTHCPFSQYFSSGSERPRLEEEKKSNKIRRLNFCFF